MKNIFKTKRPKNYYLYHGFKKSLFEGSFPSFHSQFSSSTATAAITVIYLLSPQDIRIPATLPAIIITGSLAILVAWSWIHLGVHYSIDVIGGVALGISIGYITAYMLTPILKETLIH